MIAVICICCAAHLHFGIGFYFSLEKKGRKQTLEMYKLLFSKDAIHFQHFCPLIAKYHWLIVRVLTKFVSIKSVLYQTKQWQLFRCKKKHCGIPIKFVWLKQKKKRQTSNKQNLCHEKESEKRTMPLLAPKML